MAYPKMHGIHLGKPVFMAIRKLIDKYLSFKFSLRLTTLKI